MTEETEGKCPFGFGDDAEPGADSPSTHSALAPAMSRDMLPTLVKTSIEQGADGQQTGRCLCGAVSYKFLKPVEKVFANHDENSRRWTGGVSLTIMVRASSMEFHGWGRLVHYASSARDRQCFCRLCGTSMFVRHVAPAAMDGMLSLSAGTLDDFEGMKLTAETYIDRKPDFYSFKGDRRVMTEAEVEEMYVERPKAG